jgi:hypothetical protein
MGWRRWNHALHRDFGYFCIGLTIIYAVSGIAVNHTSHDFNPSYTIEKSVATVSPLKEEETPDQNYIEMVLRELQTAEKFKNAAMLSPGTVRIFTEGTTIDVELRTGKTTIEKVTKIPLLFEWNYLHLNKAKGLWTWIADIYGVALTLLAVTGILMIRGHNKRRGIVLTIAGVLLPIVYLFVAL